MISCANDRKCTDLFFLLLWFAFWGFTIWLIVVGQKNGGDPQRIIRGVDMYGRVCGIDDAVKDQPLAAWYASVPLRLVHDSIPMQWCYRPYPSLYTPKVCVTTCKETETDTNRFAIRRVSTEFMYYCVPISISNSTINFGNDLESDSLNRSVGDLFTAVCLTRHFYPLPQPFINRSSQLNQ
jgi:hypothetical protein